MLHDSDEGGAVRASRILAGAGASLTILLIAPVLALGGTETIRVNELKGNPEAKTVMKFKTNRKGKPKRVDVKVKRLRYTCGEPRENGPTGVVSYTFRAKVAREQYDKRYRYYFNADEAGIQGDFSLPEAYSVYALGRGQFDKKMTKGKGLMYASFRLDRAGGGPGVHWWHCQTFNPRLANPEGSWRYR